MPKVGFTGRNYVAKFIKAKFLRRKHNKVVTECLTCSNHINLSFSRYNNNRGKFCSKKCDFNYKPTREMLNLFCKDKFKLSIEQLQKEVLNKKLTATKVGKIYSISSGHIRKIFLTLEINQYYEPEKESIKKKCKRCNKVFYAKEYKSRKTSNKGLFCSTHCNYIYRSENKTLDLSEISFNIKDYKFFKTLKTGDYKSINLGPREHSYRRNINYNDYFFKNGVCDENTAYVLGLWYSDGNISTTRNVCSLSLTDHQIVRDVAKLFNFKRKFYERKFTFKIKQWGKRTQLALKMTSPFLRNDFIKLGCYPSKSYTVNYPDINSKYDKHFIRGIIDGDGSFSGKKKANAMLSICGSEKLLYGIYLRIKEHLKISTQSFSHVGKKDTKKYKMKDFCVIRYGEKFTRLIADWIYKDATIFLVRKYEKAYKEQINKEKLLGTQKVADTLGVSRFTITRFIKNRKNNIKYFKIGRYHIIDNDDLENFLIKFKKYVQSKGIIYYSDEKKKYILGISKNDFKDSSTNLNLI